jgi:hypothetical protein
MAALGVGARWMLWSENVGPEVMDLSSFLYFVGGMQRFLVQDNTVLCFAACSRGCSSAHKASLAMVLLWIW